MRGIYVCACVQNVQELAMLRRCLTSIAQAYVDDPIDVTVIDDNSHISLSGAELGATVEVNKFPRSGEFYPYYYNYLHNKYDVFLVMHDSMALRSPLPEHVWHTQTAVPIWHFDKYVRDTTMLAQHMGDLLCHDAELYKHYMLGACATGCSCNDCTNDNAAFDSAPKWAGVFGDSKVAFAKYKLRQALLNTNSRAQTWTGVFGVSMVASQAFNRLLFDKYKLQQALLRTNSRNKRCCWERIIGIVLMLETGTLSKSSSLQGGIHDYPSAFQHSRPDEGLDELKERLRDYPGPVLKTWRGR